MRRFLYVLIIIVIVVALGWYAAWSFIAGKVEEQAALELIRLEEQGTEIACSDRAVTGFPVAFRLSCTELDLVDQRTGTIAALNGARAGATVYAWNRIGATLGSPLDLSLPTVAEKIIAAWRTAKADLRLKRGAIIAGSTAIHDLTISVAGTNVALASLTGDVRPALIPEATLIGLTAKEVEVTEPATGMVPLGLDARAQINVAPENLAVVGDIARLNGLNVRNLAVDITGTGLRVRAVGDLEFDTNGVANGEIALQIFDVEGLPAAIERLPQNVRSIANAVMAGALAIGRQRTIDGQQAREISLAIDQGVARAGFISIGRIPPLY